MARLTRENILEAKDIPEAEVEVKEWGGSVLVRGMSVADRTKLLKAISDPKTDKVDPEKASLYAFVVGVVEPKFIEQDYEALKEKSAAAIDRVTKEFLTLSGVDTGAVAEARKN